MSAVWWLRLVSVLCALLLSQVGTAVAAPRACRQMALDSLGSGFLWEEARELRCADEALDDVPPASLAPPTTVKVACDEDQIVAHLHKLQSITPESIVLLVTEEDLDELCAEVRSSLDALAQVSASCAAVAEDDHSVYQALLRGVATLHADLCVPSDGGELRAPFLQHSDCLRNTSKELRECAGPKNWSAGDSESAVCGTYERIATCYHTRASVACGTEAGDLMRRLVVSVASSVLGKVHCKEMEHLGLQQPEGKVSLAIKIYSQPDTVFTAAVILMFSLYLLFQLSSPTYTVYGCGASPYCHFTKTSPEHFKKGVAVHINQ